MTDNKMKKNEFHLYLFVMLVLSIGAIFVMCSGPVEAAPDEVSVWNEDFIEEVTSFSNGSTVGIIASDGTTSGDSCSIMVSDSEYTEDEIRVTLYDDGSHEDDTPFDGMYTGTFLIMNDEGESGSRTDDEIDVIDIAHGGFVYITVDLDEDGDETTIDVIVDYLPPDVIINSPYAGYFNDSFLLIVDIRDDHLDHASCGYILDGSELIPFPEPEEILFLVEIDCTLLPESIHDLKIKAVDTAGNTNDTEFISFYVDRSPPVVEIENRIIDEQGNISISLMVKDPNLNVSSVLWRLDHGFWVDFPCNDGNESNENHQFNITIPNEDFKAGDHTVEIRARDRANNSHTGVLDFNYPEQDYDLVNISDIIIDPYDPVKGDTVRIKSRIINHGEVPVNLILRLKVDGMIVDTISLTLGGNTTAECSLNWTNAESGEHYAVLEVAMPNISSGDKEVDTIIVPADNGILIVDDPVDDTSENPLEWEPIIIAGVVIVCVVAVVSYKRGRRKGNDGKKN